MPDLPLETESLRAEDLTIHSAMQSDVNGLPWGAVRLLLDHGIDGFSMAINEHFRRAVSPRPGAFWWAAPDGGKILAWNSRTTIPRQTARCASAACWTRLFQPRKPT